MQELSEPEGMQKPNLSKICPYNRKKKLIGLHIFTFSIVVIFQEICIHTDWFIYQIFKLR